MDKSGNILKSEAAYIKIKRNILAFYLTPGQIINIKQLAFDLRFSVTPLREALFALEKDGYVIRNRNDAFYVTTLDRKYIRSLFEYGRFLHDFVVAFSPLPSDKDQGKQFSYLSDSNSNIFDIDSIYRRAQESSGNIFLHGQIGLFRERSNAVRNALLNSNQKLIDYIYGDIHFNNDLYHQQVSGIFQKIYTKKFENIDLITESVLSYAINREAFLQKFEPCTLAHKGL